MALRLRSKAFEAFHAIPRPYTADGEDRSPPLQWSGVPEGTREFVLICEDPDSPVPKPRLHWLVFHISANTTQLPEGLPRVGRIEYPVLARQARNQMGRRGYSGPKPPAWHGAHYYHFRLFALDAELAVAPDADRDDVLRAMAGHVLGQATLVGSYERHARRRATRAWERFGSSHPRTLGWAAAGLACVALVTGVLLRARQGGRLEGARLSG